RSFVEDESRDQVQRLLGSRGDHDLVGGAFHAPGQAGVRRDRLAQGGQAADGPVMQEAVGGGSTCGAERPRAPPYPAVIRWPRRSDVSRSGERDGSPSDGLERKALAPRRPVATGRGLVRSLTARTTALSYRARKSRFRRFLLYSPRRSDDRTRQPPFRVPRDIDVQYCASKAAGTGREPTLDDGEPDLIVEPAQQGGAVRTGPECKGHRGSCLRHGNPTARRGKWLIRQAGECPEHRSIFSLAQRITD